MADDIYQTRNVGKQRGKFFGGEQRFASASTFKVGDKRKLFLVLDDLVSTGSTIANLISYIEEHDGKTLAGVAQVLCLNNICSDEMWISNTYGETIARAVEYGINGGQPKLSTEEENIWCRAAITLKKMGLDMRYLIPEERKELVNPAYDPLRNNPLWRKDFNTLTQQQRVDISTSALRVTLQKLEMQGGNAADDKVNDKISLTEQQKVFLRLHVKQPDKHNKREI